MGILERPWCALSLPDVFVPRQVRTETLCGDGSNESIPPRIGFGGMVWMAP